MNELKIFQERIGNNFEALSYYSRTEYAEIKCLKCKSIFIRTPKEMYRNTTCPICCKKEKMTKIRKKNFERFVANAKLKNLVILDSIEKYKNNQSPILVECESCKRKFKLTANSLSNKTCKCYKYKKKIKEKFFKRIETLFGKDEYTILSPYEALTKKIKIRHNKCGREYFILPKTLLEGKRCMDCFGSKRKTFEEVKQIIESIDNGNYELLSTEYINNKSKLKIKHKIYGTIFEPKYGNFVNCKTRCPNYIEIKKKSKTELKVKEYIDSLINEKSLSIYRRKDNKTFELDIYIPDLKLGFEFNGLYWHSSEVKPDPNYHLNKSKFFKDNFGINVVHIFEDDWEFRQEETKQLIVNAINGKFHPTLACYNSNLLNEASLSEPEIYYIHNRQRFSTPQDLDDPIVYGCGICLPKSIH